MMMSRIDSTPVRPGLRLAPLLAFLAPLALGSLACAATAQAAQRGAGQRVTYDVLLDEPQTQMVRFAFEFPAQGEAEVVSLPVWRPGRYEVLDPVGTLRDVRAFSEAGDELTIHKIDKTSWRVETAGVERVRLSYGIYANSIGDRTRHVDATHAFLSGSSVFLFTERLRQAEVEVRLVMPEGWQVAGGLELAEGSARTLVAPNYDVLVDSPIEVGLHDRVVFEHEGVPHEIVIWPQGIDFDEEHLVGDFSKLVAAQAAIFDRLPYTRYVFLVHAGAGGGGTEHLNSTIMQTSRRALEGSHERTDAYKSFLGLAAHEFFHTWNVKQLRPAGIHPYDYLHENYTDLLWVAEGGTSYYGPLSLARAGLTKEKKYIDGLARSIDSLRRHPGAKVQSLSASSFDAWTKFNVSSPDDVNAEVSFYSKGALACWLLDLELRRRTDGATELDAVLKTMFERHPLSGAGYTQADLIACLDERSSSSFADVFARYIDGVEELPFEQAVDVVGLRLWFEPTKKKGDDDEGDDEGEGEGDDEGDDEGNEGDEAGADESAAEEDAATGDEDDPVELRLKPYLGLALRDGGAGALVRNVRSDGPAYAAGILPDDEILTLDGLRLRASDLDRRLERKQIGERVRLHLLRRDELLVFDVVLGGVADGKWKLERVKEPSAAQKAAWAAWIGHDWPEKKTSEPAVEAKDEEH